MKPLTKQQVKNIIEGKRTNERIPNLYAMWIYPDSFPGREHEMQDWLSRQVCDAEFVDLQTPELTEAPEDDPEYCWLPAGWKIPDRQGLDSGVYLNDWEDVDKIYRSFPSPEYPGLIPQTSTDSSKYVLGKWWRCLFERHWSLRGMENALMDFYLYPEEVHRLYQRLTNFYLRLMERAKAELNLDGIFTSDDIGTQNAPFFSPEIFRTFFKPYYRQLIQKAHELDMHFWLHTCGNIEPFLSDFIDIGLDVIHPIQKYTMDESRIAEQYGGKICFLAGFDVQQTIPFGTPEDVRREVRFLVNTFQRTDGRLMLTMGNGSTSDWKLDSLQALFDETARLSKT